MPKTITIIANEESYQNLSSFNDIEQLNKTCRHYRDIIKATVKRSDVQQRLNSLLELLKRYSCKQLGVSYMTKNTMAEKLQLSYKTIQRLVKKLQDMNIIKQLPMKRKKDMLQTSNAIIIVPFEEVTDKTPTKVSKKCPAIKTTTVLKQDNNTNHLNVKRSPYIKFVPKQLQHYQAFFGKRIKDLYSRVWLASKKLNISPNQSVMQSIGLTVMEQLKQYVKSDKQLSDDQLCKLAYAISFNQLEQKYGDKGEYLDWGYLANKILNK